MSTQDAIYERIKILNQRELELRTEINQVRKEREQLKTNIDTIYLSKRPEWLDKLPKEFWYPSYQAGKLLSSTSPVAAGDYCPPDLADWKSRSGLFDLAVNIGITVLLVVTTWQLLFILL